MAGRSAIANMKVIVVGAGEVGFDVARILAIEQHDVVVVDVDQDALDDVAEKLDVMTLLGNGTASSVLQQAGVRGADMVIAVTAIDEVNIIACMVADRLGINTTIARVRSHDLTGTQSVLQATDFGIDLVIQPEESAAAEVARLIRRSNATDVLSFADGRLQLVGVRLDKGSPVHGMSMKDFVSRNEHLVFRIMSLVRGIRTILPDGNTVFQSNDQVFVMARPKVMPHVIRALGKEDGGRVQEVMILGGTKVGAKVAYQLSQEKNKRIKLVEPDKDRARQLAEALEKVLVIHGDATDIDLLAFEGLGEMDAFVAVTEDEESNLVTCLLAKHLGVKKTVALLSKGAYIPISQSIGLDAAVSVKRAVSHEIMRFLRGKHVLSVETVYGMDAEILQIEAERRAYITQEPLKDLRIPKGLLIGAVMSGKDLEVATGDTHIKPGDRAFVFVLPKVIAEAERLFSRK